MAELTVGQVVDGRYELEAVIGKGGMGCVFRARHVITHGKVALKVLTDTVDAELQQRFLAEARAASTIGHPAIVAVSDASRTPDGQLYLVMELLSGKPLRNAGAGLPGDQIRRIGLELLDALGAAHLRGIVHRDLKPENIFLLAGTGALKILDFGIAKVLGAAPTSTITGDVLGTIEYMAPEQLFDAANVDGRADLWAIGIILYELIAGVRPFGGSTREARYAALAMEAPMPIGEVVPVTPDVARFFETALARDPAQRFQSAAQMADALRRLSIVPQTASHTAHQGVGVTLGTGAVQWTLSPVSSTGVPRPPPGSIPPPIAPAHPASKTPILLAVGLGIGAMAIAFIVVMATRGSKERSVTLAADAVVAPPADAHVRKPDAAVIVTITADAKTIVATAGGCDDHCARLEKCKLAQPSCQADCTDPVTKDCLDHATDCTQLAACFWARRCRRPVRSGTRGCLESTSCFATNERMDSAMVCDLCVDMMSPAAATLIAEHEVCTANIQIDLAKALREGRTPDQKAGSRCDVFYDVCSNSK